MKPSFAQTTPMTTLGEKLGEGAGSEVYAFGAGRAIKLFRPGTRMALVEHEVRATTSAFASGAPAPEVLGTVTIDGRIGIVLTRCDGRSLLDLLTSGDLTPSDAGATLARVHAALHMARHPSQHWSLRDFVSFMTARLAARGVPADVLDRARQIAADEQNDGALCHGDLHFGNVLMTSSGPRIIDWISALNASPLVDVARQYLTIAVLPVPEAYASMRAPAESSFMRTYAEQTGTTEAELRIAIDPYVTVMAVMRMDESGCVAEEREMLVDFVRSRPTS